MIGFGQEQINFNSEESGREYLDNNAEGLEGIWEYGGSSQAQRLAFVKKDFKYEAIALKRKGRYKIGDIKATLETAATESVLSIDFYGNQGETYKCVGIVKSDGLIEFVLPGSTGGQRMFYKVYPKLGKKNKRVKNGEWAGNGSGIIISKSGYIITNHHVIDDADDIEVEFILNNQVKKFNTEIVQVDKVHDLAILKIVDVNFDGTNALPYNFKSRVSDVGTQVYAFGYPYALLGMGKEIKVTDGIISSKTGLDGNITTYQITAPIQAGNSGGPLFDDKGNFIGINSSGIRKDIADNVGYSIKTSYALNLIDILPRVIELPSNKKLASLPLTEQIKQISKYVVLIKVK